MNFLLQSQAIINPRDNQCYQVVCGTGMGLVHSGELADLCLHVRVERDFVCVDSFRQQYGLIRYYRFKDDVLTIMRDSSCVLPFFHEYARRAGYYKVELEDVSGHLARYLDISIVRAGGTYTIRPFFKETTLNSTPLSVSSAHAPHVHGSWPLAVMRGLADKSSDDSILRKAKQTMIDRFVKFHHCPRVISRLREYNFDCLPASHVSVRKRPGVQSQIIWLPLAFHPVLYQCIKGTVRRYLADPTNRFLLETAFGKDTADLKIQAAWYNGAKPLAFLLRAVRDTEYDPADELQLF